MERESIEQTKKFWDKIIRNPDGTLNEEQLYKELHDYSFVLDQVPTVYCHITGNTLSKVNYHADVVTSKADEYYEEYLRKDVHEFIIDLIEIHDIIDQSDKDDALDLINKYF